MPLRFLLSQRVIVMKRAREMELFQAFLTLAAVCTVAGLRSTSGRQICCDAQGRIPRTASKDHYGRTVYCDVRGQNVGASLTDSYGKTIYRDAQGRDMGSALTDCYGRTTYYDACGRVIGSSTADHLGKTVCRDAQGRILREGPKALPRLDHVPAPPPARGAVGRPVRTPRAEAARVQRNVRHARTVCHFGSLTGRFELRDFVSERWHGSCL